MLAVGASALLILLALIFVGPPSSEGIGRAIGMSLFPYILTAAIATFQPRFRNWGPLIGLYVVVFLILLFLPVFSRLAETT